MRKVLLFACMTGVCLVCGCSTQTRNTDEFSINLPMNWVEMKGPLFDPGARFSDDKKLLRVSSKGYECPQWLSRFGNKLARVVVLRYKVQPAGFLLSQIDNFSLAMQQGTEREGNTILEKGETELGGKRTPWYIIRVLLPVNAERKVINSSGSGPMVNVSGTSEEVHYKTQLLFCYVIEKSPGDFYLLSFQAEERDFSSMRPLFEELAGTFSLK